ncbi:MAG: diacylglycerol kinase [Ignavibacteria bacterium GWA2_35_9]|nr:MAG: diacylglycerol kinase [Ignavibacteria bacterium GWA2_35_9]OGU46211.1 MAG: diacylglycerol kinase [Ignavibacteria bacterium GWB2_36_8]OGU48334.1 MAG: diacylglycerol kinase [Ignavibacteria bacterium GWC2_36_12]OGV00852.1 MAG: diacylglycerol kinase [Ignavibacteria bacterium RIFOXYB2_FULL_36_7]
MRIIIISAIAQNGVIGRSNGDMPWHIKEEFQHFKNTTSGFPVIMGRKTFNALGKPLKGRLNIVITRDKGLRFEFDDVKKFHSLNEAIEHCKTLGVEKIFVIGGGDVYKQAIKIADEMILSHLTFEAEGDIYFPQIDEKIWKVTSKEKRDQFEIVFYVRR